MITQKCIDARNRWWASSAGTAAKEEMRKIMADLGRKTGAINGRPHIHKAIEASRRANTGRAKVGLKYHPSCMRFLSQMWTVYRMSPKGWTKLVLASNGKCGICEDQFKKGDSGINVDHDHISGKYRGLLCNRCNSRLGALEDQDFCLRATFYLNNFKGDK